MLATLAVFCFCITGLVARAVSPCQTLILRLVTRENRNNDVGVASERPVGLQAKCAGPTISVRFTVRSHAGAHGSTTVANLIGLAIGVHQASLLTAIARRFFDINIRAILVMSGTVPIADALVLRRAIVVQIVHPRNLG
jgi:hypothetical protein